MWIVWVAVLFGTVFANPEDGYKEYNGYKVYVVIPKTLHDAEVLQKLEHEGFDFWSPVRALNIPVNIMVAPDQSSHFFEVLKHENIDYKVGIDNLTELIKNENKRIIMTQRITTGFNFEEYHRWNVIEQHLKTLASNYSQVQIINAGTSYEGRNITGVRLSSKVGNRSILIDGGIHAREWIAPSTAMYILTQLLTSKDPNIRYIAETYDWYIFPLINPDGYEYTHTKERLWRKNRQPQGPNCIGIDLNRNWDNHFGEANDTRTSPNCTHDTFHGLTPFSATETAELSKFYTSLNETLWAYFSLHSFSQLLLIPYAWTFDPLANYDDMIKVGEKAVQEMGKRYGTKYKVQKEYDLYKASGLSPDWVKATLKTPIVFTYELREAAEGNAYGFELPPDHIIPTGAETMDGIVTTILESTKMGIK